MEQLYSMMQQHIWVIQLLSTLIFTGLIHALVSRVLRRLVLRSEKTLRVYDEALLKALQRPLGWLIWFIGLAIVAELVCSNNGKTQFLSYIAQFKSFVIGLVVVWVTIRFIRNSEALYIESGKKRKKDIDKTLVHALSHLSTMIVVIISILAAMQFFGLPISALLTFGGIGGAAVAFASKDLLANFFGGFVVYMDRPFKVGDWIRSPDKNIEGTVEYIGWRVTRIRTFDKRPLYVPNGLFLTICVENASRMLNRRIKTYIGIRYQDAAKMDIITKQVKSMLQEHPEIDTTQTLIVNFTDFAPSSLNFMVYTFTKTTDWVRYQEVQQDVFLKIIHIIDANHAECAFPTQTVQMQGSLTTLKEANYENA